MERARSADGNTTSRSQSAMAHRSQIAVSPQQFTRVIAATTKTSKTSVFESKILLKQQGNVEEKRRADNAATEDLRRKKACSVMAQVDADFDARLEDQRHRDLDWKKRQKEFTQEKRDAQLERIRKKNEREEQNRVQRRGVQTAKVNRTLEMQRAYEDQNHRSRQKMQDEQLSKTNDKLELFLTERRELRGESLAFWFNNCKSWKEKNVRHPAIKKKMATQASEGYLTPRTALVKAATEEKARKSMIKNKSLTRITDTHEELHHKYQRLWSDPTYGLTRVPIKSLPHRSLTFEERLDKQERKEKREEGYLGTESKLDLDEQEEKHHKVEERRKEVDRRHADSSAQRQHDAEEDLNLFNNRRGFAQKVKRHRQQALTQNAHQADMQRAHHYDRSLSLGRERLGQQSNEETLKMQRLASRLAKRTVLMQ